MDEEFALCWNNFQDNIQTGFQNLYDRGDLVDVTLAMDGKLLHAHKIVLAICSPYFQEMFNTNPCKHPIIILKDVSFSVMCELLQFMYQGVVNVKHTELSSFMKIAQMLQIKGLATAPTSSGSQIQKSPDDLTSSALSINTNSGHNGNNNNNNNSKTSSTIGGNRINNSENSPSNNNSSNTEAKISLSEQQQQQQTRIPISENSSSSISSSVAAGPSLKRLNEFSSESLSVYSRKLTKRTLSELSDNEHLNQNNDSMDHMNPDDVFLPPIPHISIGESPRFDLNNVKREFLAAGGGSVSSGATEHHHSHHLSSPSSSGVHHPTSPGSVRNSLPPPFNFEYNMYAAAAAAANKLEYPNDLHLNSDFTKGGSSTANHMDIPPGMLSGSQITMLSSTSLLHGNCIFNRNNTVATQQGMKTYWLCKSYRISMCRARCITHQGRVISATGVHNHLAHMKGGGGGVNENFQPSHPPPPPPLPPPGIINPTISITNVTNTNPSSLHHGGASSNILQHSLNSQQSQQQQHLGNQIGSPVGNPQSSTNLSILSHQHHLQQSPQQQQSSSQQQQQQQQQHHHQQQHPPSQQLQQHHHHQQQSHSPTTTNNSVSIQNMMQNVLTQNSNLMHISHMSSPMLNVSHHHHHHMSHQLQSETSPSPTHQQQSTANSILNNIQIPQHQASLQITPVLSPNVVSPSTHRSSNRSQNQIDSPNLQDQQKELESPLNNSNHNSNDNVSLQHHHDLSHSSIIVSNNPISSPLCDDHVTVAVSSSQDSSNNSSSHIMASISISPDQHQQFKIEDM